VAKLGSVAQTVPATSAHVLHLVPTTQSMSAGVEACRAFLCYQEFSGVRPHRPPPGARRAARASVTVEKLQASAGEVHSHSLSFAIARASRLPRNRTYAWMMTGRATGTIDITATMPVKKRESPSPSRFTFRSSATKRKQNKLSCAIYAKNPGISVWDSLAGSKVKQAHLVHHIQAATGIRLQAKVEQQSSEGQQDANTHLPSASWCYEGQNGRQKKLAPELHHLPVPVPPTRRCKSTRELRKAAGHNSSS